MNHQRVLYADKFTSELKSKLRIVSFHKRRSLKAKVYDVEFASDADMKYADRVCKQLSDVTLKPLQLSSFKARRQHQTHQETLTSSLLPSTLLTFLPNYGSSSIIFQPDSLPVANETLEEHAMCVLDPIISSHQSVAPTPTLQPSNLVSSSSDLNIIESYVSLNMQDEKQLIGHVQTCLSAMKTAQRAADELYQLHSKA
jgi:hypothetical protein